MGLVGLPNVGKSSTFNLLSKQMVPAENFPFCTINPHEAVINGRFSPQFMVTDVAITHCGAVTRYYVGF